MTAVVGVPQISDPDGQSPLSSLLLGLNHSVSDEDLEDPGHVLGSLHQRLSQGLAPPQVLAEYVAKVQAKAQLRNSGPPEYPVLVCGLPETATDDEVAEFFGCCGGVISVTLENSRKQRNSVKATVRFTSYEAVEVALGLNGAVVCGCVVEVCSPPQSIAGADAGVAPGAPLQECPYPYYDSEHLRSVAGEVQEGPQGGGGAEGEALGPPPCARVVRFGCCVVS
eukprot:RCo029289